MNGPGDFERELERELHRVLDPIAASPIPLRRATSGAFSKRLLGGAGAALGLKLATGFAVAAFAAAGAVATTEVAITGSLNPADWGQQVKTTVADCKAKLAAGQHGIGDCVSGVGRLTKTLPLVGPGRKARPLKHMRDNLRFSLIAGSAPPTRLLFFP